MENNLAIQQLLNRYGAAAPRYTSYPTAIQFKDDFQFSDELTADRQKVSLYVHIPFCRSLCSYCGCLTRVVRGDGPIQDYLVSLENEISILANMAGYNIAAGHVHFGGGSPNLLDVPTMEELIEILDIHFNIGQDVEIAIEADPRQLTELKVKGYASAGINRVSLGVQDFHPETQMAINRIQPFSMVEACTGWLRQSGIKSINFDLMYGLPLQTVSTVIETAKQVISLKPDRIAVFGYAHVPWMRKHQKVLDRYALPDSFERYEQAEAIRELMIGSGYQAVGMDHYALPQDSLAVAARMKKLRRNFQGYTTDNIGSLQGIGLSSISRYPRSFTQNTTSFQTYKDKLREGLLPVSRGCNLQAGDLLRGDIIESLMCYLSVDVAEICMKHGFGFEMLADVFPTLEEMKDDGLVQIEGKSITVTERGRPFIRSVCTVFDNYYNPDNSRHAKAV
jgi:oxygen-independent coproporphyrinogen-3 oxidase